VQTFAGAAELPAFLARTDILVCLLPLTQETRGILDRKLFAGLPWGASVVNVGRGPQLVDADLLAALEDGQLSAAVIDVMDPEPPPADHPFWEHPQILLTPHVASMTRPESAVRFVLDTIARHREGRELVGLVDRERGY
jgi:glyoxylate/hydroxypyruvate reductase A